ncbi:unnamed protein product [Paramecium octaurelia]|uniref:Uncharacterized protein n=1 Tax=Paramecium octaurelia TaxID=43137 RepID=A0A8S1YKB3_PAROT|nr:unnamed protein product [Paramecium octaurelia]
MKMLHNWDIKSFQEQMDPLKNQMIPTSLINLQAKITNLNQIILLLIVLQNQTNNSFSYSIQPRGGGSHNSFFLIVQQISTTYSPLQFQKLSIKQFEFFPQKEAKIIISYQQGDYIFQILEYILYLLIRNLIKFKY